MTRLEATGLKFAEAFKAAEPSSFPVENLSIP
jgi:hypothetical protein